MSAIDEMMAQFQLSDEERRKIMIQNALLGLGAGLMSAGKGKGSWLNNAGQGMLMGAQMGQNAVQDARAAKVSDFKMREYLEGTQAKKAAEEARALEAQQLAGIFSGQPDLSQMGAGGPTPDNAQRVIPDRAKQYLKAADFYAARGEAEKAAKYQAMAEEEFATTPQTVMRDGRAVNVLVGKRGGVKEMAGYDPTPKFREVNTGGAVNIVNDYNVPASGMTFAKTMTPGEEASNKVAWANYGLAKNADARAAANAAGGGKPQFDSTTGQFVYPPDAANPTGRAVRPEGYVPKPPEHTRRELDSIDAQIGVVRGAKDAAAKMPSAFGFARGAATMAGSTAETIAGRMDSEQERAARSYVFNIVSAAINERAGAAQSAQELQRLRSFLPGEMDNAKQVQDKLTAFEQYLLDKRKAYSGAAAPAAAESGAVEFSSLPK